MLSYFNDRSNTKKQLNNIWSALQAAREGNFISDSHWDDIATAMAWITEDLEFHRTGENHETLND